MTKKEVIDMADLMDKWTGIMLHHDEIIEESDRNIKDIMSILHIKEEDHNQAVKNKGDNMKDSQDESEEEETVDDTANLIPEMFSLRRSPIYQYKV